MIRYAAAVVLVLVPVLWGMIMIPVLDFLEKKIFFLVKRNSR